MKDQDIRKRSLSQILEMQGIKNSVVCAAVSSLACTARKYGMLSALQGGTDIGSREKLEFYHSHAKAVDEASRKGGIAAHQAGATASVAGCMSYFFAIADNPTEEWFFSKLTEGTGLEKGEPVLVLRDKLLRLRLEAGTHGMIPRLEMAAWFVKAWNATVQGRSISLIKFNAAGPQKEEFPGIIGLTDALTRDR